MVAARRRQERQSIHRSVARDRDDESDRCIQCALGEGDIERDDLFANLEDRDKETDVLGVSLQMLETAADFLLGPRERFPEYDEWLAIEKAEKEQHWKRVKELEGDPQVVVAVRPGKADRQEGR